MKTESFSDERIVVLRPAASRAGSGRLRFHCRGPSMLPTIKTGDLLVVEPYASRPVRRGDIVVFRVPDGGRLIAHRVASVTKTGLRIRGDNNNLTDPWTPAIKDILGRVVRRERNRSVRSLSGGARGDLYARAARALSAALRVLMRMFRPSYRWASERNVVRSLMPFDLKTRILAVKRPRGTELQLLAGKRMIARRPAGTETWLVRRPYKLLINVRSLPDTVDSALSGRLSVRPKKNDIMPG
ncbi:MAG: signal peptidase I [Candidatus Aminicenantes bacterium]|nr:signal peptidase I [Candidatus Aminicenantes bacterium]